MTDLPVGSPCVCVYFQGRIKREKKNKLSDPSSLATLASRRGPSQHKGEPENHAQALEASPSRALTRATQPTARLRGHDPPAPSDR